jgi:acyl carrier protein phosphodiesterase
MQAVATAAPAELSKVLKSKAVKGNPQMPPKPRLAKGIKVPRSVKVLAALGHPTDRHAEKAVIRSLAAEIHANEVRAKTRFKDSKKED